MASRELRLLKSEADHLRFEINEWRDRAGLIRLEEPVRGEGFGIVISGEMEVVQATLKGGLGPGARGRRVRGDGEADDDDGDEDDEGEGEDGMIGLGGYGGSYMDDVEDEMIMDNGGVAPGSIQLVGGFGGSVPSTTTSMQPSHQMHLHHVHQQQQQIALNDIAAAAAAAHHLEDMDDPRIANMLLKNGDPFSQGSASNGFGGFHQQQSHPYNHHHHQQQQQQQQQFQQAFPPSYLADKLWNDPPHRSQTQTQYAPPPPTHQMMQSQGARPLFNDDPQQYHQPILSVNTSIGLGVETPLTNDKSNFRTTAVKAKVANAKANARVKARTNSMSHHSHHSPNSSTHNSPTSPCLSAVPGVGNPSPIPSPTSSASTSSQISLSRVATMRRSGSPGGGSRSGSESAAASPSYELHSSDYNGGVVVPRRDVGYLGLGGMGMTNGGINSMVGGMVVGGGMNMVNQMTTTNGGHGNAGTMMMMMM